MVALALTMDELAAELSSRDRLRSLTVRQYLDMVRLGILTPADRIELIEGWLVEKMAKNQPHSITQMKLNRWLNRIVPDDWTIGVEVPIRLARSIPEPDLVVLRGSPDTYSEEVPDATAIGVLIEVSDSTLADDRARKLKLYAADRVVQVWLVNLPERRIEVYSDPDAEKKVYAASAVYTADMDVPLTLDGVTVGTIRVGDVLPPA